MTFNDLIFMVKITNVNYFDHIRLDKNDKCQNAKRHNVVIHFEITCVRLLYLKYKFH